MFRRLWLGAAIAVQFLTIGFAAFCSFARLDAFKLTLTGGR